METHAKMAAAGDQLPARPVRLARLDGTSFVAEETSRLVRFEEQPAVLVYLRTPSASLPET